jgi:hypothetical protein
MGQFFIAYLAVTGGVSAGLQVARGVVRGVTRLIEGEPRAAVAEVVGGFVAPMASAIGQGRQLTGEIYEAVTAISAGGEEKRLHRSLRRRCESAAANLHSVPG